MKFITTFLLIFFTVFYTSIFAQEFADKEFYLIDSLVLEDLDEEVKTELDSVLTLYHTIENDTQSLNYLNDLLNQKWVGRFWYRYNNFFLEQIEKKLGNKNSNELKTKEHFYKGAYNFNIAYIYENTGDLEKALKYYKISFEEYSTIEDFFWMGDVSNMIALSYYRSGELEKALDHFKTAIRYWSIEKEYDGLSVANIGIASILQNQGFIEKAKASYHTAYEFAKKSDESYDRMGNIKVNLSKIAANEGDIDLAIEHIDSALLLYKKINYAPGIAHAYFTLGYLNDDLGHPNLALQYCEKAYEVAKETNNINLKLVIINKLGELELKKGSYNRSEKYAEDAMNLASQSYNVRFIRSTYELLQKIYTEKKDYKKALEVNALFNLFKDSIYNDEVRKKALESSVAFEYEKQKIIDDLEHEKEIAVSEAQKQKNRVAFIAAAIIAGLIALFSIFIFNRLKLIRKQKRELNNAYEQLEESKKNELAVSNLKALQSQMNPHFIFNALNSVQDLVLLQDIRSSNKYLGKFSDLIRKILLSSKEQFISLEEEIEILSLYLDLEKLRFGEEFHLDFSCSVSIEKQEEIQLPAMFIQPYIENAIKHGLFNKKGEKHLKVAFRMFDDNTLECIVEDNGVGQKQAALLKKERLHLHTGFSTEAINERIRLLNQTLEKKIELEIIDLEENGIALGTKIILLFPV